MASIEINAEDLRRADVFLTTYLKDKIPDADFSEGGVVRDFTVKAVAYLFAYLEKERQAVRDRQSLLTLGALPEDESVDDAVDALLSNWFIKRKQGKQALLTATLHFSKAVDITLPATVKFFRATDLVYLPKQTTVQVIPASELRPTVAADGTITDYTVNVTLIAQTVGDAYNAQPGRFIGVDPFNPFFLYAENLAEGADGRSVETTSQLLERAPTAISVRNLINGRSIDTVLKDAFPNIARIVTVGFGEEEMIRDLATEAITRLKMHVGGHNDIYVSLPRTEITETLTVGGLYARADNVINILRDPAGWPGVTVGHVLRVSAGLPDVPREFIIVAMDADELVVHPRTPFTVATDEQTPPGTVSYSVGTLSPSFDNTLPLRTTGTTSRRLQTPGRVVLTAQPHYGIKRVEVLGSPVTVLGTRVNGAPGLDEYQVQVRVPGNAQSAKAVTEIIVNAAYEGQQLRVTYETLVGYGEVQQYVTDRFERVVVANPLVKAFHPVYLSFSALYRASNMTPKEVNDLLAPAANIFINTFDSIEAIDAGSILSHLRNAFPSIQLAPFKIDYTLIAPDGQVYAYETTDVVSIYPDSVNGARLLNGLALKTPILNADLDPLVGTNAPLIAAANDALRAQLKDSGVSDRVVSYLSRQADLTFDPQV
jgi:hypothetical protein